MQILLSSFSLDLTVYTTWSPMRTPKRARGNVKNIRRLVVPSTQKLVKLKCYGRFCLLNEGWPDEHIDHSCCSYLLFSHQRHRKCEWFLNDTENQELLINYDSENFDVDHETPSKENNGDKELMLP